MSKSIRQNNLDFIFFLGSSPIPTSIPFGIIVWDVQHRTHPWFPELQPGWSSRDELYSYVLPRASIVITGTNVGRNELVSLYGVYEKNIYIIPHPVPADVPEYSQTKSSEGFQFLYPAQFWPHKNHVVILEAMNKLRQQKKLNFKVVFAGSDKGNLPYIEELISEYKLTGFIEVKGFVPRSELLSLYQSCNALVYSSFSGPENLPPLEAFRSSLPVLYADFPGAREQLGQAALFFNPTDENDLAEKFLSIVNDLEMREKLISEGRLQLQGRTSSDFARKLIGVLESFSRIRRVWK
jgi:glycosyltransferase involved in cell wall biosynthesis